MRRHRIPEATLHLDPDHIGLRLVVLLTLFVSGMLGFATIRELLRLSNGRLPDYTFIVSCAGAIPIALVSIWVVEIVLKRIWHSGRRIELDETGIAFVDKEDEAISFDWQDNLSIRQWTFDLAGYTRVGQERQMPKRWVCLSTELFDENASIIVYTFLSRRASLDYLEGPLPYQEINPRLVYETSLQSRLGPPKRPIIPDEVLMGKNGRYWAAEQRRWQDGHQLTQADYKTFIHFISQYVVSPQQSSTGPMT